MILYRRESGSKGHSKSTLARYLLSKIVAIVEDHGCEIWGDRNEVQVPRKSLFRDLLPCSSTFDYDWANYRASIPASDSPNRL